MSSDLKQVTSHRQLTEVGELEQDLVLGEKNSKDLINFLAGEFLGGKGSACCFKSCRHKRKWIWVPVTLVRHSWQGYLVLCSKPASGKQSAVALRGLRCLACLSSCLFVLECGERMCVKQESRLLVCHSLMSLHASSATSHVQSQATSSSSS